MILRREWMEGSVRISLASQNCSSFPRVVERKSTPESPPEMWPRIPGRITCVRPDYQQRRTSWFVTRRLWGISPTGDTVMGCIITRVWEHGWSVVSLKCSRNVWVEKTSCRWWHVLTHVLPTCPAAVTAWTVKSKCLSKCTCWDTACFWENNCYVIVSIVTKTASENVLRDLDNGPRSYLDHIYLSWLYAVSWLTT